MLGELMTSGDPRSLMPKSVMKAWRLDDDGVMNGSGRGFGRDERDTNCLSTIVAAHNFTDTTRRHEKVIGGCRLTISIKRQELFLDVLLLAATHKTKWQRDLIRTGLIGSPSSRRDEIRVDGRHE